MTVDVAVLPESRGDHRLGRHKVHDSRSISYSYAAMPWRAFRTAVHKRHIPILDQENLRSQGIDVPGELDALGSCTGNAGVGFLGTMPWFNTIGSELAQQLRDAKQAEQYAIEVYSAATKIDEIPGEWPDQDTGSSGLAIAKVLKQRRLMTTYLHAFGLGPLITALQSQPVLFGIPWYEAMFTPKNNGTLEIAGAMVGGHQLMIDAVYMEQRLFRVPNSWGPTWGSQGFCFMTFEQVERLLSEDGDVVVPYR